jgi:elongation factor G
MADFAVKNLRNVALVGHSGAGKTSLVEAMLFNVKAIDRMGRVGDGNTVTDFDAEEIRRGISVSLAVAPVEWKGVKINLLDAPGYTDFFGEVIEAMSVADAAVVVLDSLSGVEVGTELAWKRLNEYGLPRLAFVNRMERENANFQNVVKAVRDRFEVNAIPAALPIGAESKFAGVIDLVSMKAYMGADPKPVDIPANMMDEAEEARQALVEAAAEGDDELIMKFLEGEELTDDEVRQGLRAGVRNRTVVPVLCGAAVPNVGVMLLLSTLAEFAPSPDDRPITATNKATQESIVLQPTTGGPLVCFVFKTVADPFIGKLSYFRIYSGDMHGDNRLINVRTGEEERIGQLYSIRGKEQAQTLKVGPGDIGAVAKLAETATGDTLCEKGRLFEIPPLAFPAPFFSVAVNPKTKADLDKLGNGLNRLVEEDPSLRVYRDPGTHQTILSGLGDTHVDVASRRMQQKFGVDIVTSVPKVPYRETVTQANSATYRHKKQTGGAGQFGEVSLRVEPREHGAGFEFTSEVFGGAISSSFYPSIEKGVKSVLETGIVAGYPVVDVKAIVFDGKEHPVDSKDIAFQIAGREAFKLAFAGAKPILMEPIMTVEISVPEQFMGDVLGDLNTRRARVQGMAQEKGVGTVTAQVPLAEMQRYATDLRSFTQGRGIFTMKFDHYEQMPSHAAQAVIDAAKKETEKEKA